MIRWLRGSRRSRAKHDPTTAVLTDDRMRNCVVRSIDIDHGLLRRFAGLLYALGNFLSLTETETDLTVAITAYNEGTETETPTTFYDLGASIDVDDLFERVLVVITG